MHKVYLLLRNNQQSGPYGLEELLQLGLKPDDLLWIEGKSEGWFYPSELDDLKAYVTQNTATKKDAEIASSQEQNNASKTTREKKIFVSLPNTTKAPATINQQAPKDDLEQKAEALRKKIQAYATASKTVAEEVSPTAQPASEEKMPNESAYPFQHLKQDDTTAPYYTPAKVKGFPARNWAIGMVAVLLLIVGTFIWKGAPDETVEPTNGISAEQALPTTETPPQTDSSKTPATEAFDYNIPDNNKEKTANRASYATKRSGVHTSAATPQKTNSKLPVSTSNKIVKNDIPSVDEPVHDQAETTTASKEEKPVATVEKKKSLGKRIDDLFDRLKRKKETESAPEGPGEHTIPSGTSERKSVHRNDEPTTETAEAMDLTSYIDITANEPKDNWMMGIRGLKITLRNRSNETIQSAKVEVRYYSEQNELLQKKTISFANIPPKKSATVPAPDHSLADHTDYALLSASN